MKSVVEYFQEMYGFTIQCTHLPCLQVGNQKKANYLPMEVVSCHCDLNSYHTLTYGELINYYCYHNLLFLLEN